MGIFLTFSILFACQSGESPTFRKAEPLADEEIQAFNFPNQFNWQAHRGGRGLMPENTTPAFLHALRFPVRTLELDVVINKEEIPIVSHEPWISSEICLSPGGEKLSEKEGKELRILDMTYKEIRDYNCGGRRLPEFPRQQTAEVYKPTLLSVLRSVKNYAKANNRPIPAFNIEIKSRPEWDEKLTPIPRYFVYHVLRALDQADPEGTYKVTIQSFDPRALEEVRKARPGISTALLVENKKSVEENLARLSFKPDIYSPRFDLLTRADIDYLHEQEIKVIPWTVNQIPDMVRLINKGVDGIITDYPDLIMELSKVGQNTMPDN